MPTAQRTSRVRSASDPTAYRHKVGEGGDYHRQIEEAAEYRRQIQLVEEYFRQLSVVEEYFNFDTVHNDVSAGEQRFSSSDSDSADLIASGLSFGQDAAGDISLHHQTGESSPFEPAQLHIHLDMGPGSGQGLFEEHGAWQTLLGDDDLTGTTLAAGDHDSDVAIGVALESTIEHADQPEFGFATPEVYDSLPRSMGVATGLSSDSALQSLVVYDAIHSGSATPTRRNTDEMAFGRSPWADYEGLFDLDDIDSGGF